MSLGNFTSRWCWSSDPHCNFIVSHSFTMLHFWENLLLSWTQQENFVHVSFQMYTGVPKM